MIEGLDEEAEWVAESWSGGLASEFGGENPSAVANIPIIE
jgi:hypothetical protein